MKKVIFINTKDGKIEETTVNGLADMQRLVGGRIERAFTFRNGDELYVNEEGLFESPTYFFEVAQAHQPFAGNAYVIGGANSRGDNTDVKQSLIDLGQLLLFLGEGEIL